MVDLEALLGRTSRTFALSIPRLPEPTRGAVTLAYLLFRIADTFEDAAAWPKSRRAEALEEFVALLTDEAVTAGRGIPPRAAELAARWVDARPCAHEGYLDLVAATPEVLAAVASLDAPSRAVVLRHAVRTAAGMKGFVMQSTEGGDLALGALGELRDYCYVVAGIVGELLTELFMLHAPALDAVESELRGNARDFGEGLQLVNILKDAADDARDGRVYLPTDVPRSDVLALARADLGKARTYVLALQGAGAPRGFVEFTALPVVLARATLDKVEHDGPGAKLPRAEVFALAASLDARLDEGAAALD